MKTDEIVRYADGLFRFVDVGGWQKWFEAAVLGFAFALDLISVRAVFDRSIVHFAIWKIRSAQDNTSIRIEQFSSEQLRNI